MTTSASLCWADDGNLAVRPDGGRVAIAQREVIKLDFSRLHPVPDCAQSLSDFLDEFEALPDVAPHLENARKETARLLLGAGKKTRLSYLRMQAGLSQGELADKVGTSQSAISMMERGLQKPGLDSIRALAGALEVDFNTLIGALDA